MPTPQPAAPGRILGIGGIFFQSASPEALRSWYSAHLGFGAGEAVTFPWRTADSSAAEHCTVWSVFPEKSPYFGSSPAPFMINYIVDDLDALLARLASENVSIDPKREDHEYGRFAWITDPDGNRIELWQPPQPGSSTHTSGSDR